ncbi:hypothetical protein F2Q69_00049022 [Brassica cretica]|uniref:Uncharacterized protein n=1 Tax=Brassica cretica TaxID=69181 RepID=A0A8S9PRE7_BRACR|nr:hypothetical protein F2Q69_00049022 [Brassica cretica]
MLTVARLFLFPSLTNHPSGLIVQVRSCELPPIPLLHEPYLREEKVKHGSSCSGCFLDTRRRPPSKERHRG